MLQNKVNRSRASQQKQNLKLINAAIDAAKQAASACRSDDARDHLEFVLAFLRESWIAESGQDSNTAEDIFDGVQRMRRMEAAILRLSQR